MKTVFFLIRINLEPLMTSVELCELYLHVEATNPSSHVTFLA